MFKKQDGAVQPAAVPASPADPAGGVAMAATVAKTGMSTGIKVLIGILVTVFVVGGGGVAFLLLRTPSHIPADAQKLMFRTFEELVLAEDVRFKLTLPGETLAGLSGEVLEDGAQDLGVNPNDFNLELMIDTVQVDAKRIDGEVQLGLFSAVDDMGVRLDSGFVDENIYMRIGELKFEDLPFDISELLGLWVDLDLSAVREQVNAFLGETEGEETALDPEDYVYPDVKKTLERIRDVYMLAPPLDLTLLEENAAEGTATLQLRANENAKQFVIDATVESYVMYIGDIDSAIAENASAGNREIIAALETYREGLVKDNGERGELMAQELEDQVDLDELYGTESPVSGVAVTLTIDVNTGRAIELSYSLAFKDGKVRAPVKLEWSNYNIGNTIEVPDDAVSVEEYTEILTEIMMGGAHELHEGDVDSEDADVSSVGFEMKEGADTDVDMLLDSDGDALTDWDEMNVHSTDKNKADTDGDGLDDFDEINTHNTDPLNADTDGDGFADGVEVDGGYNPLQ